MKQKMLLFISPEPAINITGETAAISGKVKSAFLKKKLLAMGMSHVVFVGREGEYLNFDLNRSFGET